MPGIEFVVDRLGRKRAVLVDLKRHGALWEDVYDAYVAQKRRNEPRESIEEVKRLISPRSTRKTRG